MSTFDSESSKSYKTSVLMLKTGTNLEKTKKNPEKKSEAKK
jgi:hypothetical protein